MELAPFGHLSKSDHLELLSLSHRALTCTDYTDLKPLVADLRNLFPFDNALCARVNLLELVKPNNHQPDIDVCNISHPDGFLDRYFDNQYYYSDVVLFELFTNLSPVSWHKVSKKCGRNLPTLAMARDFNIHDGWSYGTIDIDTMDCTVFCLGGFKADRSRRCAQILKYIIPFYSQAYRRVLKTACPRKVHLTSRQVEVLNWIKAGKSSWEISIILNCSKRNVDFHIGNIKPKLGAVTRAQAVAVGLEQGIIKF